MAAAKAIAAKYGHTLTSAVLPRNQCDPAYIRVLRDLGFTAYRGMENNWVENKVHVRFPLRILRLTVPISPSPGTAAARQRRRRHLELRGTQMFRPIFKPAEIHGGLKGSQNQTPDAPRGEKPATFHLWWHPHNIGVHTAEHMAPAGGNLPLLRRAEGKIRHGKPEYAGSNGKIRETGTET